MADPSLNGNSSTMATRKPLLGQAVALWKQLELEGKVDAVEDRAYNDLASLKEEEQVEALNAVSDSTQEIRNQSGFLIGVVRRIQRRGGLKQVVRTDLPQSVQAKLKDLETQGRLDGEAFDKKHLVAMSDFSEEQQIKILQTFMDTDKEIVKNGVGYIGGIIKRFYRQEGVDDKNKTVPESVQQRLDVAYKENPFLKEGDLDERCMRALKNFPESLAMQLVDDFLKSDLSQVGNKGGFFFGIVKRFERRYHISADGISRQSYGRREDFKDRRDRDYRERGYGDRRPRDRDYRDRDYRDRDYRDYDYGHGYRENGYGNRGGDRDRDYRESARGYSRGSRRDYGDDYGSGRTRDFDYRETRGYH